MPGMSVHDRRNTHLELLLENVGADQAVRLGDPKVRIEAVEALKQSL